MNYQLCLPLNSQPRALLPVRAIGCLSKRELLNLCADDLSTLLRERRIQGVLMTHALLVLRKLNFGLIVHQHPRPGVIHIFDKRFSGKELSLDTLPHTLIAASVNQFV